MLEDLYDVDVDEVEELDDELGIDYHSGSHLGELGTGLSLSFGGKAGGTASTSGGVSGSASGSASMPAGTTYDPVFGVIRGTSWGSATKPATSVQADVLNRAGVAVPGVTYPSATTPAAPRTGIRRAVTLPGVRYAPKDVRVIARAEEARRRFVEPTVIDTMAAQGIGRSGCPVAHTCPDDEIRAQIAAIGRALKLAQIQREATSESRSMMTRDEYRAAVLRKLGKLTGGCE